jgi:hypothetical protein
MTPRRTATHTKGRRLRHGSVNAALSLATLHDAERLFRARREHLVTVDQDLVLISQIQRSGGTLLNSLLDGHPEIFSHPYELLIGHPSKHEWPALDPADGPERWLEVLDERIIAHLFAEGYRKDAGRNDHPALPFGLVPSFLERLFRVLVAERDVATSRDILDCYMTAFFGAWFDLQGYHDVPKRWVAAFTPRAAWGDSRARFVGDYPQGRQLSIVRDPRAWFASIDAPGKERFSDFDAAIASWLRGADEILAAKAERPAAVLTLTYEALVQRPEAVLRAIADWLGISWHPILLTPTYNRLPVFPNSSHTLRAHGIRLESLEIWRTKLPSPVVRAIEDETLEAYETLRASADIV